MTRGPLLIIGSIILFFFAVMGKFNLWNPELALKRDSEPLELTAFLILGTTFMIGSVFVASDRGHSGILGFFLGLFTLFGWYGGLLLQAFLPPYVERRRGYYFILCGVLFFIAIAIHGVKAQPRNQLVFSIAQGEIPFWLKFSLFIMGAAYLLGSIIIAIDKGYSALTGLLLGVVPPVGFFYLVRLSEKNENKSQQFQSVYQLISNTCWWAGGLTSGFCTLVLLIAVQRNNTSVPVSNLMIVVIGVGAAIAFAGASTLLALAFAPQEWLTSSDAGLRWLKRTGSDGENQTRRFRILTAGIGLFAAIWLVGSTIAGLEIFLLFHSI